MHTNLKITLPNKDIRNLNTCRQEVDTLWTSTRLSLTDELIEITMEKWNKLLKTRLKKLFDRILDRWKDPIIINRVVIVGKNREGEKTEGMEVLTDPQNIKDEMSDHFIKWMSDPNPH